MESLRRQDMIREDKRSEEERKREYEYNHTITKLIKCVTNLNTK